MIQKLQQEYSEINKSIIESINKLKLSNEQKDNLLDINEKLYHYALKINTNSIRTKVSFFYLLKNLSVDDRNIIITNIRDMFVKYDLCNDDIRKVDVSKKNPYSELNNIFDYDFWIFDFVRYGNMDFMKNFIPILKKTTRDLIKCIFFTINEKEFKELNECIENEENAYKDTKYQFDCIFQYDSKYGCFQELEAYLTKNGFECNFNEQDLLNVNDYPENEVFIESSLIKSNIMKNDNKLSFKDLYTPNKEDKSMKLDQMVGLENVKDEIKKLESLLNFYKDIGKENSLFLNTVFKGNPGTGKTTVARNYADMLYKLGYIKTNNLIEIVPTDLMGEYVGETKNTTREILYKAKGGVLFIDEAYNLNTAKEHNGGTFMREAVVELLKYMEDKSNVVIYAGYKKEMEELLDINPGFKSRIGSVINFDDYSTKELIEIFKQNADKYNLKYDKTFEKKLEERIEKDKKSKNFGNARYVESLLNKILLIHADNVYKNNGDLYKLTENDLDIKDETNEPFGFIRKEYT